MQKKLIIANWKSNKLQADVEAWLGEFKADTNQVDVVIAPPFTYLAQVGLQLPAGTKLGAQTVSSFPMGSYTGAVNAHQLKGLGVKYVIVGHSERRRYFHEDHQDVAKQVQEVVAQNMTPVLCLDKEYIEDQAHALDPGLYKACIVAYEPLAAIGSGHNEPVGEVKKVVEKIREVYGAVPVIYGGSVTEDNIGEYMLVCDGALVGGASLEAKQFDSLVAAAVIE